MQINQDQGPVTKTGLFSIAIITGGLIAALFTTFYKLNVFSSNEEFVSLLFVTVVGLILFVLFIWGAIRGNVGGRFIQLGPLNNKDTRGPIISLIVFCIGTFLAGFILLNKGIAEKDKFSVAGGCISLFVGIAIAGLSVLACKIKNR